MGSHLQVALLSQENVRPYELARVQVRAENESEVRGVQYVLRELQVLAHTRSVVDLSIKILKRRNR